jgi:hypothetical protein
MTMHMMGHAYDTVNRGRLKARKLTKRDHERLTSEWQDYNRYAKQNHLQKVTFSEYVDSAFGRNKVQTRPTHQNFTELERPQISNYRRDEGVYYPSADSVQKDPDACSAPERKQYTGDLIAGIATMHKSNAVPVMKGTDEAKDIARMRR